MQELRIDSPKVEEKLVEFIRLQMREAGCRRIVVGLSGGLDSALAAYLSCRAQGEENVFAFILPYKTALPESALCAELVARKYQVQTKTIDITPQIDAYFERFPEADNVRRGNKMARERMSVLYDQAKALSALVVGTSNKTERLLGYGTIYGDLACAFNPLGELYKTQLRQLAQDIGIPQEIINRTPTADLWPGQTDEGELGMTYADADRLLYCLIDKKLPLRELQKMGFTEDFVAKVQKRIRENAFKGRLPAIAKIEPGFCNRF